MPVLSSHIIYVMCYCCLTSEGLVGIYYPESIILCRERNYTHNTHMSVFLCDNKLFNGFRY